MGTTKLAEPALRESDTEKKSEGKRSYHPPKLTRLGLVSELTRGSPAGSVPDGAETPKSGG